MTSIVAPIVPHLAEEIWQHWPDKHSAYAKGDDHSFFMHGWQEADPTWINGDVEEDMNYLRSIRAEIMNLLEQARKDKYVL